MSDEPGNALILQELRSLTGAVNKTIDDHEKRLRVLEESHTRMSERLALWQLGQSAYTTLAAIISGVLSRIVK